MHFIYIPRTSTKRASVNTFTAIDACRYIGNGSEFRVGDEIDPPIQPKELKVMAAAVATATKSIYFVAGHVKTQMNKAL